MPQKKSRKQAKPKKSKAPSLTNNVSPRPVRPPKSRVQSSFRVGQHHVRGVCAVTDPFCPAAKNSKWPDGTSGNTFTQQFRGNTSLTADSANGNGAFVICPQAPYGYMKHTGATTSSTVTFPAAFTPWQTAGTSMLETHGDIYRIVSFGVIVRSVASATNAAGLVTLGSSGTFRQPTTTLTLGSELYDEVVIEAIQPGLEVAWIAQPRTPVARSLGGQSVAAQISGNGWSSLTIEYSGCNNSATVLNVEWFINIEFNLKANDTLAALATRNPPKAPIAETATSHVHSTLGSFVSGGVEAVEKAVADAASTALVSFTKDPLASLTSLISMF
jgi:hypothetical protein